MSCELMTREFKNSKGEEILFAVRQLPASKALEIYIELMRTFGVSIFPFIDDKYGLNELVILMRASDHETTSDLIKRVICTAACDNKEIKQTNFNTFFDGELMLLCQVFAFVVEVNFYSFLQQGLEMNAQRLLEAEEASKKAEQQSLNQKT